MGGLAVRVTVGPSGQTNSPHPSSREGTSFHRLVELECSPIAFDPVRLSCRCNVPGPAELGAINPDAVHDHGQPTGQVVGKARARITRAAADAPLAGWQRQVPIGKRQHR